ncbi:MAG: hypothetical protein JNL21_41125 [Myxococcales bacterium]|nr:hypothetical protein [Myxococcales bacterium]
MLGAIVSFACATLVAVLVARRHAAILKAQSSPRLEPPKQICVRFEQPLELGLLLVHNSGERAGVASVRRADDLPRTLGLFTRAIREALDEAAKHGVVEVSDDAVTLKLASPTAQPAARAAADLAAHRLRSAIDEARAELAPPDALAPQQSLFVSVAERLGGRLEPWPLSVTFGGPSPVRLVAARTGVRRFEIHASARLAPRGARAHLPERIRGFLERGLGGGALAWDDGFVTLLLGDAPHPTLVVGATRKLIRLARLLGTGHATRTGYRESPSTARARRGPPR